MVAMTMQLPQADDIARLALQELPNGPTLVHPDDLVRRNDDEPSPGHRRREHVVSKSAEAAVFIGE